MQSKIELQSEIDTQNIIKPVSYYKNYMISPIGNTPTQFNQTSNPQITFELPADSVINFSKMIFSFKRTATFTNDTNNNTLIIPQSWNPFISRIELYTQSQNLKLLDLNWADIYSKASCHLMNNFLKNPAKNSGVIMPKALWNTDVNGALPNSGNIKNSTPITYDTYEYSTAAEFGEKVYNYRLGDCYGDTIFNLNKSIYIAKSCFLRITFNNYKRIQGAYVNATGLPVSINAGAYMSVSNFTLKIYTENDPLIIEQVKKQNSQGITYIMPDIVVSQLSVSGSGVKGLQTKFSNMTGNTDSRLYKCYSILSASGGTLPPNAILPTSNYNNQKFKYISLFLNSSNILNLDCESNDEIQHLINQHEDHSITDENNTKDNGVICNVFDTSPAKKSYEFDELKGLSWGSGDITINWQYTIASAADNIVSGNAIFDNYQFGIILRKLYARDGNLSSTVY